MLAEIGLRLSPLPVGQPRLPLRYDAEDIDRIAVADAYVRFSPTLGWEPTPGIERGREGARYRHNAQGIRANREFTKVPGESPARVLAFGDSFTYCEGVGFGDCWTSRLQARLPGSEVLNFGVPGYGPDQAWLRYQESGSSLRPCAVLIGVLVENINRVVNRFRPYLYPPTGIPLAKPRFILEGQSLVLLPSGVDSPAVLKDPEWVAANLGPRDAFYFPGVHVGHEIDVLEVGNLARTAVYRRSHQELVSRTLAWEARTYHLDSEAFQVLEAVVVGFAREVIADGSAPLVLVFPTRGEIEDHRDGRPKYYEVLLKALKRAQVPFIDLAEALGDAARNRSIDELIGAHYRDDGNAVVARAISRELPRVANPPCSL